jgi:tetratricopeptide (TPR) repeat protein
MNTSLLLLLVGLLYVVLGGGLSLLRREGLSAQFALEAVALTALFSGAAWLIRFELHPAFFLLIVYVATMRVRLLVDLGTFYARRGNFGMAERIYRLGERLCPSLADCLLVKVNRGAARVHEGKLDEASALFEDVLSHREPGALGIKNETAAHYNLGVIYRRRQLEAKAIGEFHKVVELWPISEYARRAQAALQKRPKE